MGDNVSAPVAADALYTALDDLMARAGALTAERRCAAAGLIPGRCMGVSVWVRRMSWTNKKRHTTSSICQYHAAAPKPKVVKEKK